MLLVSANSSMLSKPMIAPCFALYFTDAFSIGIFTTSIIEKHEQIDAQAENVERPMQTAPIVPCSLMPSSAEIMPSSRPAPAIMGETIRQNLSVLSLAYARQYTVQALESEEDLTVTDVQWTQLEGSRGHLQVYLEWQGEPLSVSLDITG